MYGLGIYKHVVYMMDHTYKYILMTYASNAGSAISKEFQLFLMVNLQEEFLWEIFFFKKLNRLYCKERVIWREIKCSSDYKKY